MGQQQKQIKIAPSILSADFGNIAEECQRVEKAGADALHIDVMDGHFVPNLSLGPQMVSAIKKSTELFLDVHLMIYHPYQYIEAFTKAGADRITIHFEATEDILDTLSYIRKCNIQAGLAFNPSTSPSFISKYLSHCDMLLLMTVEPGFSGQKFLAQVLQKITFAREQCDQLHLLDSDGVSPFPIEVDGGIDEKTSSSCIQAGANILVSGSYLFRERDLMQAIEKLRNSL